MSAGRFRVTGHQVVFLDADGNATGARPATPVEQGLYEAVARQREELEELKETLAAQDKECCEKAVSLAQQQFICPGH